MTYEEKKFLKDSMSERLDLIDRKSKDYGGGDPLDAFIKVAHITNLPVKKVFEVLIALKVTRLANLSESNNFESYQDSVTDLTNYSDLLNLYNDRVLSNTTKSRNNEVGGIVYQYSQSLDTQTDTSMPKEIVIDNIDGF